MSCRGISIRCSDAAVLAARLGPLAGSFSIFHYFDVVCLVTLLALDTGRHETWQLSVSLAYLFFWLLICRHREYRGLAGKRYPAMRQGAGVPW